MSDERRDVEVERALGRLETPWARADFRARLRAQFLAGRFRDEASPKRMASAPGPVPLLGLVDEAPALPLEEEDGGAFAGGAEGPPVMPPRALSRLSRIGLVLGGLATVAACAAGFLLLRPVLDPLRWNVLLAQGTVKVDGVAHDWSSDPASLEDALRGGSEIETSCVLRVRLGDRMLLETAAGTDIEIRRAFWTGRPEIELRKGAVRVCTGPAFAGSLLAVRSADIEAVITGTAIAVDIIDGGTCVCCTEGNVQVDPLRLPDAEHVVEKGRMTIAWADASPCRQAETYQPHVQPLYDLQDTADELWR